MPSSLDPKMSAAISTQSSMITNKKARKVLRNISVLVCDIMKKLNHEFPIEEQIEELIKNRVRHTETKNIIRTYVYNCYQQYKHLCGGETTTDNKSSASNPFFPGFKSYSSRRRSILGHITPWCISKNVFVPKDNDTDKKALKHIHQISRTRELEDVSDVVFKSYQTPNYNIPTYMIQTKVTKESMGSVDPTLLALFIFDSPLLDRFVKSDLAQLITSKSNPNAQMYFKDQNNKRLFEDVLKFNRKPPRNMTLLLKQSKLQAALRRTIILLHRGQFGQRESNVAFYDALNRCDHCATALGHTSIHNSPLQHLDPLYILDRLVHSFYFKPTVVTITPDHWRFGQPIPKAMTKNHIPYIYSFVPAHGDSRFERLKTSNNKYPLLLANGKGIMPQMNEHGWMYHNYYSIDSSEDGVLLVVVNRHDSNALKVARKAAFGKTIPADYLDTYGSMLDLNDPMNETPVDVPTLIGPSSGYDQAPLVSYPDTKFGCKKNMYLRSVVCLKLTDKRTTSGYISYVHDNRQGWLKYDPLIRTGNCFVPTNVNERNKDFECRGVLFFYSRNL